VPGQILRKLAAGIKYCNQVDGATNFYSRIAVVRLDFSPATLQKDHPGEIRGVFGIEAATAQSGKSDYSNRLAITVTVMLASGLYALDWTIATVALPHMQGTFSATQDQVSWVITSYLVVSAIMLPVTSWLASKLGRKRLFVLAVSSFTISSWLCGAANSLEAEVLFRICQGASGAFLIPLSQSIMLDTYPQHMHTRAMALWGVGVMLGPVIGPTLGGYLTEQYSWRWVFFINLPMGLIAVVGSLIFLKPDKANPKTAPFDWLGFVFLGLAIGSLQAMLDRGERRNWFESGEILLESLVAAVAAWLFVVHAFTARAPLIHLRLFADRNYALGNFFVFIYGLLTLAPLVLMPPFLQELQGYPITDVGILLSPRGIGMMMTMMVIGRLGDRLNPRAGVATGFVMLAITSFAMSGWTLDVTPWDVAWTGFIQGAGAGAVVVSLSSVTFLTLPVAFRTEASSVWNLVRSIGSSIGVAIALAVLLRMTGTNRSQLGEAITRFSPLSDGSAAAMAILENEVTRQAYMIGYIDVFYAAAIASIAVLPLIWMIRKPPPLASR
jgi:DHA2 family multidrug resistance protein